MEQEIGNISIALIRKLNPAMKGIGNDFIMDSTEYYIPDVNSIFKYPPINPHRSLIFRRPDPKPHL